MAILIYDIDFYDKYNFISNLSVFDVQIFRSYILFEKGSSVFIIFVLFWN